MMKHLHVWKEHKSHCKPIDNTTVCKFQWMQGGCHIAHAFTVKLKTCCHHYWFGK